MGSSVDEVDALADIGSVPMCRDCRSERVVLDAWACWNPETGLWELEHTFDEAHCHQCDGRTSLIWERKDTLVRTRVRELNDQFRTMGIGRGTIVITHGVQERGDSFVRQALDAVRTFEKFTYENDPWQEHDFGAFGIGNDRLFWKIDPYDLSMTEMSPNPANEAVTARVLTIMMSQEY